ncbi:hypothetical protein ACRALDRAFT_1070483 [Sodiomyces alcalophilus JCM 7366]|uniref:uncharacterized protein n=1 Tax=Sodiomyces alcalophilus JCM 7366 TaxID=591952 RepID=UPI0039B3E5D2
MTTPEQELPFIRNLASSDKRLRIQALTSLQTFLTAQRALDRLTALKLWKGLFFALWMCDKPIPQQNLCAELADLYTSLPAAKKRNKNGTAAGGGGDGVVPTWFGAAWEVLANHWTEIDVLRMDKFLLLTRRIFAAHLRWVRDGEWDEARQASVIDVLKAGPFESEGDVARVPLGLRLHVLDIWVDEMERVGMLGSDDAASEKGEGEGEGDAVAVEFADRMRRQVIEPLTSCIAKPVRKSAAEQLEDERLPWVRRKKAGDGDGDAVEEEEEWGGIED